MKRFCKLGAKVLIIPYYIYKEKGVNGKSVDGSQRKVKEQITTLKESRRNER